MVRFARPRSQGPLVWWHESDPVRFQALQDYCKQDVLAERELDRKLPELSPRERQVFELDHAINQRGLGVDHHLVYELAVLADTARGDLTREIVRLTGGRVRSLGQVAQLRDWLKSQGVEMPDLRRATVQAQLADQTLVGSPRIALQARLDASRSSTAKLTAIASARSCDGRVRGTFQYYGAARTGRWAGRRLQPQNLFRGSIRDVPAALRVIRAGAAPEDLELLFEDSALGVIASCLRSTITAGSSQRLGHLKFQATALTYGVVLSETEAEAAVRAWREVNHHIVTLWWESHRALLRVLRAGPGAQEQVSQITFIHRPRALLARLPSGRHLVYRHPRIELNEHGYDEVTYMGSLGGSWTRLRAWAGRTVENVTQAVARDVMVEAMLRLVDLPLIATIHDELITEVPESEADGTLARMLAAMRQTPAWAPGLPIDAAGFVVSRYQKG
jgi:DNA polymerase